MPSTNLPPYQDKFLHYQKFTRLPVRIMACQLSAPAKRPETQLRYIRGQSGGKLVEGNFPLEQVVIDQLPPGTLVVSCNQYGASEWTVLARIDTLSTDSKPKAYFLKGRPITCPFFWAVLRHHSAPKLSPELIPKPHAWGQFNAADPKAYYYLCDFLELTKDVPDPVSLCEKLVTLQKRSASPSNMFGFHVKPLRGNLPLDTTWNPSWQSFFIQLFRGSLELDQARNRQWSETEQKLIEQTMTHVVPRVLGPLETGGRFVKASHIHGGTQSQPKTHC
ncbi:hypothetical protein BU24DRAFT_410192 [Aaosphaeria arxii CBS 175.79]|uniref:Uncharacterized protein n=1 Tax=Aaosphaeria arxii CBS 175.79 TaxID=1450172 RepID=A0A6A5XNG5_9PLEO|nr:uncharacterized protein BU24DRAFT_410192 [Aaosphaeria arxii CBS 175.79]KAF2014446.1 hypothetical protein BU24DRAFT_410192 [Aaosphaeria arxii CBS 175.79]